MKQLQFEKNTLQEIALEKNDLEKWLRERAAG